MAATTTGASRGGRRKPRGDQRAPNVGDVNSRVRSAQALRLLIEGRTYESIAAACGFRDKSGAYRACQRELDRYMQPVVEQARAIELARLDALLQVFMVKALKGDGWSADRVLRIAERRARLLGLDHADMVQSVDALPRMYLYGIPESADAPLPTLPDGTPAPRTQDIVIAVPQDVMSAI